MFAISSTLLPLHQPLPRLSRLDALQSGLPEAVRLQLEAAGALVPKLEGALESGLESLPTLPSFATWISETRDELRLVLTEERALAVVLLALALAVAVLGGLTRGTAASLRDSSGAVLRDPETEDALFRTELTKDEAARFDAGGAFSMISVGSERTTARQKGGAAAPAAGRRGRLPSTPINTGLWVELALCVLLDMAGDASLFYPTVGDEAQDVGFAIFQAFCLELFFDWPALAIFALWEEGLPFIDFIPSATIGWFLVVVAGARPQRRAAAGNGGSGLFRSSLDPEAEFAPGVRPPIADRRAYQQPEPYLRPRRRSTRREGKRK